MSNRSFHFVRRLQTLPSALAGVSGPRRLLTLAAVLALLALMLLPTVAQAQTVSTVFSATFTPTTRGTLVGCSDQTDEEDEYCSNRLTNSTFVYDGTTYTVSDLYLTSTATLEFGLTPYPTAFMFSELTLNIGDSPFPLSSATESARLLRWASSGLTWTADSDSILVTLTVTTYAPDDVAVVSQDWSLIPPGVSPGQRPRRSEANGQSASSTGR